MQGRLLGSEQVTVTAAADGWTIRGTGRLAAPVDLSTTRFEMRYDREWRPLSLEVEGTLRGRPLIMRTAFAGGSATTDITQAGQQTQKVDAVSADPVVLPNMFFSFVRGPGAAPARNRRAGRVEGLHRRAG